MELKNKSITFLGDSITEGVGVFGGTNDYGHGDANLNVSNQLPLKAYVDKIKETAEVYSIPVLDLYSAGGICPDIQAHKERYVPDGLHPNDAGAEKIAKKIKSFLESL